METVLVGIDVSDSEFQALRWALDYCRVTGAELVGVIAYEPVQAEEPPDWYEEHIAAVTKQAEAAVDRMGRDVPYRIEVHYGDPRSVLAEAATGARPALVVVGARGGGGFAGLGLGRVAHHLAHHLQVPLVIVPAVPKDLRGSTIVVGADGSPASLNTLRWAVHLASAARASVHVVYAYEPLAASYPHPPTATDQDRQAAAVQAEVASFDGTDVKVVASAVTDHPVAAITLTAAEDEASLIVIGRRGAGGLRGLLLGHVPAQLPYHAHRPVAIIPHLAG